MSKARRSTEQEFFDVFADWKPDDQERALRVMSEIHRQAVRLAKRRPAQSTPEAPAQQQLEQPTGEVQREDT
jgi:hypothetical protein